MPFGHSFAIGTGFMISTQAVLVTKLTGSVFGWVWFMNLYLCYKVNLSTLTFCLRIVLSFASRPIRCDSKTLNGVGMIAGGAIGRNPVIRLNLAGGTLFRRGTGLWLAVDSINEMRHNCQHRLLWLAG